MSAVNPEVAILQLQAAREAFALWAPLSITERLQSLRELRQAITEQREAIVADIVSDTGKPPLDALGGDLLVTLEFIRYYEQIAAKALAPRHVAGSRLFFPGTKFTEIFEPHGVALIFGPANYPFQLAMIPAITAILAGNSVLLKASERTPRTALRMAALVAESLPKNLVQVVQATPEESLAYIDAGPEIIFFTGSTNGGRFVATKAAEKLIPIILELGGKDAALVFADAPIERTLEGLAYGAFSNAGQVCVGSKRIYVEQAIYKDFLERFIQRIKQLRVGSSLESDLGRLTGVQDRKRFQEQIEEARARGATLEVGSTEELDGSSPVVLCNLPHDARLLKEESFGPVVTVERFSTEEQAIALANESAYGLAASIWSSNMDRAERVARRINAGSITINDVIRQVANPAAAFGGNKNSGYGRYHGVHGLYAFSRIKTIMASNSRKKREVNWFPFASKTYRQLDALLELRHGAKGIFSNAWKKLFLIIFMFAAVLQAQSPQAHLKLRIELSDKVHGGQVAYAVFNSASGFPNDVSKALLHGFVPLSATTGAVTIDAGPLSPGQYAASVYIDENFNRKLDTGFLGIPKEPVGVSNNPRPRFGPPRYSDSVFTMGNTELTITIKLVRA
jgi:acyl-CoA reductase-like NAD-dependent aldehyde dehydrogenase/uncharacterized protein (DUF2141 family)